MLRALFAPEALPLDSPATDAQPTTGEAQSLLSWLFGRDVLPQDEPSLAEATAPSLARWLLAREPLPLDPPVARSCRPRGVSMRWLFGREPLADAPSAETDEQPQPPPS